MPIPSAALWLSRGRVLLCALVALLLPAVPCSAQFYPKVDYYEAAIGVLKDAVEGDRPGAASLVGSLASLRDPDLIPLFEAMTRSDRPTARVFGVLALGLARGDEGLDPQAILALRSPEERAAAIREANATGLLQGTPLQPLLQSPGLDPGSALTLAGELDRRGETWDLALLQPIAAHEDPTMAGIASLLLLSKGDAAPWQAFLERWKELPEPRRTSVATALAEGALVFEIEQAVEPILAMATLPDVGDDAHMAAVGVALTLNPKRGLQAWQERLATRRTQPQLVRAALQLLAANEQAIPASAFEQLRNGTPVLEALAAAGKALRSGSDPSEELIALLKTGHPMSADWAMLRARTLPPEQATKVWMHVIRAMDNESPQVRPTPTMYALAIRELMQSDPSAVHDLAERARTTPLLAVALMSGVYDSGLADGAQVARSLRGSMPRAGESLAALILARSGAPLTDDDLDALGRAAAGGGDLEAMRAAQAAWYLIKRKHKAAEAFQRITPLAAAPTQGNTAP